MIAEQPRHSEYGCSRTVDVPYEEAVEKVRTTLKAEGFGVLTEIDIREKLKEKLGVEFRRYTILGACNLSAHAMPCSAQEKLRQIGHELM